MSCTLLARDVIFPWHSLLFMIDQGCLDDNALLFMEILKVSDPAFIQEWIGFDSFVYGQILVPFCKCLSIRKGGSMHHPRHFLNKSNPFRFCERNRLQKTMQAVLKVFFPSYLLGRKYIEPLYLKGH